MCRLLFSLFLLGCFLNLTLGLYKSHEGRGEDSIPYGRSPSQQEIQEASSNIIRKPRELQLKDVSEEDSSSLENLSSEESRPTVYIKGDIGDSTASNENSVHIDEERESRRRPGKPRPKPSDLPIQIKPLKNLNSDGELDTRKRPGRPRPKPSDLPIQIKPLKNLKVKEAESKSTRHKTPILNIQHDFTFPVVDAFSHEKGDPVIEEKPGISMDTRPLSERKSPNSLNGDNRHASSSSICGGLYTSLSGIISSPDYPFNYPTRIRCVYKIVLPEDYTVGLDCNDFSVQPGDNNCENDFLEVSDNGGEDEPGHKFCGDKAVSAFSHSSNMTIVFQTDTSYQYRGFMCRYRALNSDGTGAEGIVQVNATAAEHTTICTGPGDDGWAGKCGVSNQWSAHRIVGGLTVREHQFPWMVAVLKECGKELDHYCHICGGTVIHSQWILTGAHCIVSVDVQTLAILLGDHNLYELTPSQKFFRVESVYVHPDFNVPSPLNNDIALAKLPQNMAFSKYIAPICIPPSNYLDLLNLLPRKVPGEGYSSSTSTTAAYRDLHGEQLGRSGATTTEVPLSHKIIHDNFVGRNISVYGWGTINDDKVVSKVLRKVTVPVLPNDECNYYYGVMTDTMMCTSGYGGQGPCQGDSGSPAQMKMVDGRWMQVGVLAFGAAYGCEVGYPSGNVLLPLYVDWLEFVTGFDFTEYY